MTDLTRELALMVGGLADSLEAVAGPTPIVEHARRLAKRGLGMDAAAAPAPDHDGLRRLVLEYFTTDSFPRRALAGYDIQEMLGVGDAKERAERRPVLERQRAEVDALRRRAKEANRQ